MLEEMNKLSLENIAYESSNVISKVKTNCFLFLQIPLDNKLLFTKSEEVKEFEKSF